MFSTIWSKSNNRCVFCFKLFGIGQTWHLGKWELRSGNFGEQHRSLGGVTIICLLLFNTNPDNSVCIIKFQSWPTRLNFHYDFHYPIVLSYLCRPVTYFPKGPYPYYVIIPEQTREGALLTNMSNRVEHQKRNQPAIEKWPFGFVFGVQLGVRQTQALIKTKNNKKDNKNTCSSSRSSCWS